MRCIIILLVCLEGTLGFYEHCRMYPPEVEDCIRRAKYHPVNIHSAQAACLRRHYEQTTPNNNLTRHDRDFFNYRVKTRFGFEPSPTGFGIRREYRRITDKERYRLHKAFNILYKKGIVGKFARLHATAHRRIDGGAAFLAWHRVFITDFEQELKRVDPTLMLPYWDITLDSALPDPTQSIIWSPCFLGNGAGVIKTGAFAGWYGATHGPIERDFNKDGRLINSGDIKRVLLNCFYANISITLLPPFKKSSSLEKLKKGVFAWIGGDFSFPHLSAFDPAFYMTLAYIDYIWETFRQKQVKLCDVNPEKDYPSDKYVGPKGHRGLSSMPGYEHLRNIDGLRKTWVEYFYRYESSPTCPDCRSPYLRCDKKLGHCVTKTTKACPLTRIQAHRRKYFRRGKYGYKKYKRSKWIGKYFHKKALFVPPMLPMLGPQGPRGLGPQGPRGLHPGPLPGHMWRK